MKRFGRESETGPVEYKLRVDDPHKIEKIASQMKYRLNEGGGEAWYELGVTDDGELIGIPPEIAMKSIENLRKAASLIPASLKVIRKIRVKDRFVYEIYIRRIAGDPPIITIPTIGNVDSGKSTLIGVLAYNILDDGRGSAMALIARHPHEIVSGRTSAISTTLVGFDKDGKIVNKLIPTPSEDEVYIRSSKIVCFVDLAGHEKYFKTSLRGVCAYKPDYAMFVVAANAGPIGMAKEQFGVAVSLRIPIFCVITKIDLASEPRLSRTLEEVSKIAKLPSVNKIPYLVKGMDDVAVSAKHMTSGRIMPIFLVSNKTGSGLDLLSSFLNLLPPRNEWADKIDKPFKMYVEEKFNITGIGPVVHGLILQGSVKVGDDVYIGPLSDGSFEMVKVKSIEVHRVKVDRAIAGKHACLALKNIEYRKIEKGMSLLDAEIRPEAVYAVDVNLFILNHPTMIRRGYEAVAHIMSARQTVKFVRMSKEPLRTGDTATVRLKFLYRPLYVTKGDKIVLREGRTRAIGIVEKVYNTWDGSSSKS